MRSPARTARSTTPAPDDRRGAQGLLLRSFPFIQPGTMGVPAGDDFETNFVTGERNIFRQTWQRRADASLVKELTLHDQYTLRYSFDVYNVTNTTSFDIPQNNVNQNYAFNNVPVAVGSTSAALPTGCGTTNPSARRALQLSGGTGNHQAHHRQPAPDSDGAAPGLLIRATILREKGGSQRSRPFSSHPIVVSRSNYLFVILSGGHRGDRSQRICGCFSTNAGHRTRTAFPSEMARASVTRHAA